MKSILRCISNSIFLFFLLNSSSLKAQDEFHFSGGFESSFIFPTSNYVNSTGTQSGFKYQLSYQHIFKHIGFMISYENVKRDLQLNNEGIFQEITILSGQGNSNRIMFYFVGRFKVKTNWIFDARFGIGKLLNTKNVYHYDNLLLQGLQSIVPGLSIAWAFKTHYKFSKHVGAFVDLAYTLTPYSYSVYKDNIWFPYTDYRSSYISNLSLSLGLAFYLKK